MKKYKKKRRSLERGGANYGTTAKFSETKILRKIVKLMTTNLGMQNRHLHCKKPKNMLHTTAARRGARREKATIRLHCKGCCAIQS